MWLKIRKLTRFHIQLMFYIVLWNFPKFYKLKNRSDISHQGDKFKLLLSSLLSFDVSRCVSVFCDNPFAATWVINMNLCVVRCYWSRISSTVPWWRVVWRSCCSPTAPREPSPGSSTSSNCPHSTFSRSQTLKRTHFNIFKQPVSVGYNIQLQLSIYLIINCCQSTFRQNLCQLLQ